MAVPWLEGECGRARCALDNFPGAAASGPWVGPKRPSALPRLHDSAQQREGALANLCHVLRILIGLASGVAVGLAFEPARLVWLLPLGIAGLVWCVHGTRTVTAALHGLLFGAGFMLTLLHWLRVIGVDAWLALSLFEALYFAGAARSEERRVVKECVSTCGSWWSPAS